MTATGRDRQTAVKLLRQAAADGLIRDTEPRHQPEMVERIAAALADERERARAPFLALAEELEAAANGTRGDAGDYDVALIAYRILRAAEATP